MSVVALIVGSLSKQSLNRHYCRANFKCAPENVQIEEIDISNFRFIAKIWMISIFRLIIVCEQIKGADAVLIASGA